VGSERSELCRSLVKGYQCDMWSVVLYVMTWAVLIALVGDDPITPPLVFSVFAALKGVGNITSGISQLLYSLGTSC
jgi:hypothetical protein